MRHNTVVSDAAPDVPLTILIHTAPVLKGQLIVNTQNPIRRVAVSYGEVVDGLKIWYQLRRPGTELVAVEHGSQFSGATVVELQPSEILLAVFGRAGYQNSYKRKMVNSIGFVIFDQSSLAVRVEGVSAAVTLFTTAYACILHSLSVSNSNKSNNGEPFHVANVMAFGGYAKPTTQYGLAGLSFYKDLTSE
ncbi:uncharacterized protein B0H18DRAFT_1121164 [Fomitopsis serialis]|uniref:uncharacterized protein n=1 Tax=Fomitopsis serialis TaxID=139415 RepID=UPI002007BFB2|nr:uncharacterized protein B0H18DRAFT_1121164 [Neoantrodia serialis]KAH9921863.1 hypothetical protein B0H18DRAFT_1121164 [Neoantrodia serialis]